MALTPGALAQTAAAFDGVAPGYDQQNERNVVIRWMRARARRWLLEDLPAGASILDLGCGPGTDAVPLAEAGFDVTAMDWSAAMVEVATARSRQARVGARLSVCHVGLHEVDRWPAGTWDAALSNLGPLNCVPDLDAVAHTLHARLRPGGRVVVSVIGRWCPWEWLIYTARADWRRLRVRTRAGWVAVPLEGRTVWMQYLTPRVCIDAFAKAGFVVHRQRALGVLVPPPYLEAFCARHPTLVAWLMRLEDHVAAWPVVRGCGDHFLLELRRS